MIGLRIRISRKGKCEPHAFSKDHTRFLRMRWALFPAEAITRRAEMSHTAVQQWWLRLQEVEQEYSDEHVRAGYLGARRAMASKLQ